MTTILIAISLFCMFPSGSSTGYMSNEQLRCRKEMIKCMDKNVGDAETGLKKCMLTYEFK